MKLWDKGYILNEKIEKYTVNDDFILDMKIIKYDIQASIAHARMLKEIQILNSHELSDIERGLNEIQNLVDNGKFIILRSQEDCHTAIEEYLTKEIGEAGKKIHAGRSRNDQILTALRLYEKHEIEIVSGLIKDFNTLILSIIESNKDIILPGYTHTRRAMPLSLASWLGSVSNAMKDNLVHLAADFDIIDNNPLGSAAGFGVPVIQINKKMTSEYLGFGKFYDTDIYYQNTRGKIEGMLISSLNSVMFDLNKLASDLIFYSIEEFDFIDLPHEICTGSSIMPQKKNPDVLELIRANYHILLAEELKVKSLSANLISGYHRDLQLTKSSVITAFDIVKDSLEVMGIVLSKISFNREAIKASLSRDLFAVEKVNTLLKNGKNFREAYKEVAAEFIKK